MKIGGYVRNAGFDGENPKLLIDNQWNIPWKGWLAYRWISAIYFSLWIIPAMKKFGTFKFFIFLTSWAFVLLAISLIHRAVLLTLFLCKTAGKSNTSQNIQLPYLNSSYKFAWMVDNMSSQFAVYVSIGFWLIVNWDGHIPTDALIVNTHGANAVYVLVDLFLSTKTIRMLHVWQSIVLANVYILFTIMYWFAGGTALGGEPFIYEDMNWNRPERTLPLSLVASTICPVLGQLLLYSVCRLRIKLHSHITGSKISINGAQYGRQLSTEALLPL